MKTLLLFLLVCALGYGCMAAMNSKEHTNSNPNDDSFKLPKQEPKENKPAAPAQKQQEQKVIPFKPSDTTIYI